MVLFGDFGIRFLQAVRLSENNSTCVLFVAKAIEVDRGLELRVTIDIAKDRGS